MSYELELIVLGASLPAGVYEAQVLHDEGCPKLKDGECECDAEIKLVKFQM